MSHASWCDYPNGPCDCREDRRNSYGERNDTHKSWCDYPSGPCDCGKDKE